jgi:hypothetical protein
LNSFCAAALQETGKFTSPSFSAPPLCGERASRAHAADAPVMKTIASIHAISVAFFMFASIGKLPNKSHRFDGKGVEVFAEGLQ